jgi:CarD family transcriptional regulator
LSAGRKAAISAPTASQGHSKISEAPAQVQMEISAKKPFKPSGSAIAHGYAGMEESGQKLIKNTTNRQVFKTNEFVVYPAHGVGQIVSIEEQEVAGFKLELFVINFAKDKMTLRVPTSKVTGVGMRKLSDPDSARKSLEILTGRPRIKRTMWSRRAQEYETKINSGDIDSIAEVVRDLYRSEAQPEQSYSERQLYEAALDRMAREIAVVQKLDEGEALKVMIAQLQKGQKRGVKPDGSAEVASRDASVDEAA